MRYLRLIALASVGTAALFAQQEGGPVHFGLLGGVPITDMFTANNTSMFNNTYLNSPYSAVVPRYEFGASAEFGLPGPLRRLRFEVDGIYKRGGFDFTSPYTGGPSVGFNKTTFNNWEIPGLFKYNFTLGHYRPFFEFGGAYRHIAGVADFIRPVGYATPTMLADNVDALHNRNSYGGVAGFGVTFKKGPFEISPEVRYTRWANESFEINGLRTNLDQGDALIGFSF